MNEFDAHVEAVKLGGMAQDCMDKYCKQLPVEAMQSEQAIVKEAESFWNDNNKLFAVSKEFEKINQDRNSTLPKVDILVGDGKVLLFEFTPRAVSNSGVEPELSIDKGDVDRYKHQGVRAFLEDHANKNTSIVVNGSPDEGFQKK